MSKIPPFIDFIVQIGKFLPKFYELVTIQLVLVFIGAIEKLVIEFSTFPTTSLGTSLDLRISRSWSR